MLFISKYNVCDACSFLFLFYIILFEIDLLLVSHYFSKLFCESLFVSLVFFCSVN